jgi:hypothetical protein
MFYTFAMLALVVLNTVLPAPAFFSRALESNSLLHHVAGRPKGGIGNSSKSESQDQSEAAETPADPERPIGAFLTEAQVEYLFKGHTAYGFMVDGEDGPFQEYFASDGKLRGHETLADWSIEDGTLCVKNEGEEKVCFKVRRLADAAYALVSDGRVDAYLKVVNGNPFEY